AVLPDPRLDRDFVRAGSCPQRLELDLLVAVVGERAGVGAHEQRLELLRKLLLLLRSGLAPARPDSDLRDAAEIEVRDDLRLDERGAFGGISALQGLVSANLANHLFPNRPTNPV